MSLEAVNDERDLGKVQVISPFRRHFKMFVTQQYAQFYLNNAYEAFTAELLLRFIRDGCVFIDIGAHYGFYTLLIGSKYAHARIFAFEPVLTNYEILRRNIVLNKLANVVTHNCAVSNKNEVRDFNIAANSGHCSFYVHPLSRTIGNVKVNTVALDDIFREGPASDQIFIKIDTEGHEIYVLEGMKTLIEKAADIQMVIEFSPLGLKSAGYQPEALLDKIDQLGFDIYLIDDELQEINRLAPNLFKSWEKCFGVGNYRKDYFNIFCTRQKHGPFKVWDSVKDRFFPVGSFRKKMYNILKKSFVMYKTSGFLFMFKKVVKKLFGAHPIF